MSLRRHVITNLLVLLQHFFANPLETEQMILRIAGSSPYFTRDLPSATYLLRI